MSSDTMRLPAVVGTAEDAYLQAAGALAVAGLAPGDVVHVVEYATGSALAAYAGVERARAAFLGEHPVPVSTVAVEAFPSGGGAELAVQLTAHPGGGELLRVHADQGLHRGTVRLADEILYLPSIHPHDGHGLVHEGDFRSQYRYCLERAEELLKAAGSGLESLVQTTDYTMSATRAEYPRCGRPRKELLGGAGTDGLPVHPGAAGILVDQPVVPGAMVSLDAVASIAPLRAVNPGWQRYETLAYKPGVAAGNTLFMSGFGALEPATQKAVYEGDLLAQAEFTYTGIAAVLGEAGLDGGAVTRLIEYITPDAVTGYEGLADLRRMYFGDGPALTSAVCSALLRPEFLIEVVPTAVFA